MKKTVYTNFSCKETITVVSTQYKDGDGSRIWTDGKNYYELRNTGRHFCMRGTTWAAQKLVDDIISNGEKYGTYID